MRVSGTQPVHSLICHDPRVHDATSRASKVLSTGELTYSMTPMTADVAEPIVAETACSVTGLGYLQLSNEQGVVGDAMYTALTAVRNGLDYPAAVCTPHPNGLLGCFILKDDFEGDTAFLDCQIINDEKDRRHVFMHPIFESLRSRRTFIWAVRVAPEHWSTIADDKDAHWCLVIGEIDARPQVVIPRGNIFTFTNRTEPFRDVYYDRSISHIQVFNPMMADDGSWEETHNNLARNVKCMLEMAGIAVHDGQFFTGQAEYPKVRELWQTGFQCFGIAQEYMRRVNVRANLHLAGPDPELDRMMHTTYTGLARPSVLRESMIAACATRAVTQSGYKARVAVELPGKGIEASEVAPGAEGRNKEYPPRIDDPDADAIGEDATFVLANPTSLHNGFTYPVPWPSALTS